MPENAVPVSGSPVSPKALEALREDVAWSLRQLSMHRAKRQEALTEYIGRWFTDESKQYEGAVVLPDRDPANLLKLAVNIYARFLASRCPQIYVTTRFPHLLPAAKAMQEAINALLKRIDFERVLRGIAKDALFGDTGAKVGIAEAGRVTLDGVEHVDSQPFCDHIDADDWVQDMQAKEQSGEQFRGNRYRMLLRDAQKRKRLNQEKIEDLSVARSNKGGDRRVSELTVESSGPERYLPVVELWDLYLPQDNLLITVGGEDTWTLFGAMEWQGPRRGPYHRLRLEDVPGQPAGQPLVSSLMDMATLVRMLMSKLSRQALAAKTVHGFMPGAEGDAEVFARTADGGTMVVNQPNQMKDIVNPGPQGSTVALAITLKDLYSWLAGNLDVLGGLGTAADTLGQERLMVATSSKMVQDWQDQFISFVTGVVNDMAHYWWTDPLVRDTVMVPITGTDIAVPVAWADVKAGAFNDYQFELVPYSMARRGPGERIGTIMQTWQQVIMPAAPILAAAGLAPDVGELLKLLAELSSTPELNRIVKYVGQRPEMGAPEGGGGMPANTNRTYTRVNTTGKTRVGQDMAMAQALLGSANQQQQAVAAGG